LTNSGRFELKGKPPGTPGNGSGGGGGDDDGDSTGTTGASWTGGQFVADTTGKVLFQMANSYHVCSASIVTEGVSGRSIVLTAAHCAYDETNGKPALSWMFIPNYDAKPTSLSTSSDAFCDTTEWGCWTAFALVGHDGFALAGEFSDQAVAHDFAFAVLGLGGHGYNGGNGELVEDTVNGSWPIGFTSDAVEGTVDGFGYPAAQKYKGKDLVYCEGTPDVDPRTSGATYKLACNMTGGSSGGPWLEGFDADTNAGTLTSLIRIQRRQVHVWA
jgi:hypothetical protein